MITNTECRGNPAQAVVKIPRLGIGAVHARFKREESGFDRGAAAGTNS